MARDVARMSSNSQVCKVVMLGDAGCGKSCMLTRYLHDKFKPTNSPTIGAAFGIKTIESSNGSRVSLQIWDTAGQERYQALANLYYRNANAAIICCDLTDKKSYQRLEYWLRQVRNQEKNCKIYVCGNKADLLWHGEKQREVSLQELQRFDTPAFETSSKTNHNITQVFQAAADGLEGATQPTGGNLSISRVDSAQGRKKCCS